MSSGESAGTAVFLAGEDGCMFGNSREGSGEKDDEAEEDVKNDEVESDDGEKGFDEVDVESNLFLLGFVCLAYSRERGGRIILLPVLTITTTTPHSNL